MALNYVQPGKTGKLPVPADSLSGDPQLVGDLAVVQLEDEKDGEAMCGLEDVYSLDVTGEDDAGNVAMSAGEKVYWDGGTLNADATNGTFFGHLLDPVGSGATENVRVRLKQ